MIGDTDGMNCREAPKYRCHKEVHALKIADIKPYGFEDPDAETDGSLIIFPADEGYGPFRVPGSYARKHDPKIGGYYVIYEDGYTSFSPAAAFESGYTKI